MIETKLGLLLLLLISVYSQTVAGFYFDEVERGDKFIDDLLYDMMYENGHVYDPFTFEDSVISFSKKIAFVNITGEAKLHNGLIVGLKTLHRSDHCLIKEINGKLNVEADLGAGVMDLRYDGTVKFMKLGPTIKVYGQISYLETHMKFTVDAETGLDGVLQEFYIDDMKGMKVWITGLGPLNWAANYLISGITSLFKRFIKNMLEKQVRNYVAESLPNYRFPVEDSM